MLSRRLAGYLNPLDAFEQSAITDTQLIQMFFLALVGGHEKVYQK